MIKKEIVDLVLQDTGLLKDTDARDRADKSARLAYMNFYNAFDWREKKSTLLIQTPTKYLRLPAWVSGVQAASWGYNNALQQIDVGNVLELAPQLFDTARKAGTTDRYSILCPSAATYIQVGGGVAVKNLQFSSTSVSDVNIEVSIFGADSYGMEQRETITLSGTNTVSSAFQYSEVYEISKSETVGTVIINDSDGVSLQANLLPKENRRDHIRIILFDEPKDITKPILFQVTRGFGGFWNDNDSIKITAAEQAIIATVYADMLEYKQDYEAAKGKRNDANSFYIQAVNNERVLNAYDIRATVENPCVVKAGSSYSSKSNFI